MPADTKYTMRIGPYTLSNNLILAPMAGVTDRTFRQLCREMGAGLAVSEMVIAKPQLWGSRKTQRRIDHHGESSPISVQIAGTDPQMMADTARYNVDHGAEIIDINMGCPAKKVCNALAGSALLRDEALVGRILEAVVNAVSVPVTLKIRTGWEPSRRNGVSIARIAEHAGIQALAVHGRTRACGFNGEAEYETIAAIKAAVSIPIIANGDIDSPPKALQVLQRTGADALMIGRAAQGRPWLFREIKYFIETGTLLPEPSIVEIRRILIDHLHRLYEFYGEHTGVRVARKHIAWYSKGQNDAGNIRQSINKAITITEQLHLVRSLMDAIEENINLAA